MTAIVERGIVHVEGVDPRDATREVFHTVFRVYFYDRARSMASDEYELRETDAREVLSWTDRHAEGRLFEVWVTADLPELEKTLILVDASLPSPASVLTGDDGRGQ